MITKTRALLLLAITSLVNGDPMERLKNKLLMKEPCESEGEGVDTLHNRGSITGGTVLCPDFEKDEYCDCDGDCSAHPDWCSCTEAKECCEGGGGGSIPDDSVLCPGLPTGEYCDCDGDCSAHPDWCSCAEAKECCEGTSDVVLCPGLPTEDYCDCDGDCSAHPDWCSCTEAKECCKNPLKGIESSDHGNNHISVA